MRPSSLNLVCGLAVFTWMTGCGGGGNTPPPPTPITITTTTLSQGTTNTSYNATLGATGGTPPYIWSVTAGNLPTGLALSTAGVLSGTPTQAGIAPFTVGVKDSETTPETASQDFKLAISGGALAIVPPFPPAGQVGSDYNFQLTATGGVPPYTWAGSAANPVPPGLALNSSGVISGTPTTAGAYNVDLSVTDSANNTSTQNVPLAINPAGQSLPNGGYSFMFSGTGPHGTLAINGTFLLQNQAVVVGIYDENQSSSAPETEQLLAAGGVVIGANGLGQLKLTLANSTTVTFALASPPSISTPGSDSNIRIIEFDDTTGSGTRGSGILKPSALGDTSAIQGDYAFSLSGVGSSQNPIALAGSFHADGKGSITGYAEDENNNGAVTTVTGFSGTDAVDTEGRGTMQFMLDGNTYNYSFYQVMPSELLAISVDPVSGSAPLVSGSIEQQAGNFSTASLNGIGTLELNGLASSGGALIPNITLGLVNADGSGKVSITYDEYKGQLLSPQNFSGTYAVDSTSGRVVLSSSGTPAILYLLKSNEAFVLGGDASASSGLLEPQSGTPFSTGSFKGNYLGGSVPLASASVTNGVALVAADGNGNLTITFNGSGPGGLEPNQSITGTYTVSSNGRTLVTAADGITRIFYAVSPTKVVLLSGGGIGYLGSFEQ